MKTHCQNGHEFTAANVIRSVRSNGVRYRKCRTCHTAQLLESAERNRKPTKPVKA